MTPEEILIADLEKGVKLRLPTAVHRYLALRTDFDIRAWELSPAKFENKWRLALLLMEGEAQPHHIISVLNGGILYRCGAVKTLSSVLNAKMKCRKLLMIHGFADIALMSLSSNYRCFCFLRFSKNCFTFSGMFCA